MNGSFFRFLTAKSKLFFLTTGIIAISATALVEYFLGYGVSISIFYLVPISLITWYVGRKAGNLFALICSLLWFGVDELSKNPFAGTYVPFWNAAVRLTFFLLVVLLVDGFKREKTYAREDYLTGLGNRRDFFERAYEEMERSDRYGHSFSLAYIDVDHFKAINDRFGHSEGDALLKAIAATMKENVRSTDLTARLGGDEFAVLLPESGREAAEAFFLKLHSMLSDMVREHEWPVSFSLGVVTFEKPPGSIDEMISIVDAVLYSAKDGGRNIVKFEIYQSPPAGGAPLV